MRQRTGNAPAIAGKVLEMGKKNSRKGAKEFWSLTATEAGKKLGVTG